MDESFALLADQRRRVILTHLSRSDARRVPVEDLVEVICPEADAAVDSRKTIWRTLHHVHLPKLDANDIIEYQPEQNTVVYRPCEPIESMIGYIADEFESLD